MTRDYVNVIVPNPRNLSDKQVRELFDTLDFSVREQKVANLKDVILTTSGGVLKSRLPVLGSHFRHYRQMAKHIAINYGNILRRRSLALPAKATYTSGHNIWSGGYFHWVTESLPRIALSLEANKDAVVIIPDGMKLTKTYTDSVKAIGAREVFLLPTDRFLSVPKYLLPENPHRKGEFDPRLLRNMRKSVISQLLFSESLRMDGIIYVSRRKSRGRRVANEDKVLEVLKEFGAREVFFEEMTFSEQVNACATSKLMISIHGAGLSNLTFLNDGGAVIELLPDPNLSRRYAKVRNSLLANPSYCRLSAIMNMSYFALVCAPVPSSSTDLPDISVDTEALRELVMMALSDRYRS
ncbi:MAG: glycosyltransferase family 61 protein [Rhodobacterales bacterium]